MNHIVLGHDYSVAVFWISFMGIQVVSRLLGVAYFQPRRPRPHEDKFTREPNLPSFRGLTHKGLGFEAHTSILRACNSDTLR